ncbi:MAG: hypothetical protein KDJ77_17275 [Rhodobiaceae bacterium]|nr:hypothetical protein [Rhodobiaceae bacterium]
MPAIGRIGQLGRIGRRGRRAGNPLADKFVFAGTGFRALTRATTSLPTAPTTSEAYGISRKIGGMPAWQCSEVILWFPTVVCHTSNPVTGSNETDIKAGSILEGVNVSFDGGSTFYDVTFGGSSTKTIDPVADPGGFWGTVELGGDLTPKNATIWVTTAWHLPWADNSTQGFFGQSGAQKTNLGEASRDASTSLLGSIEAADLTSLAANSAEFYAPIALFAKGNDGRAVFACFGDSRLYFQDHQDKAIWPVAKGDWPANPRGAQGDIELAFDREETWKLRIPAGICAVPGQNCHDWAASDTDWRTFKIMIDAVTALNDGVLPFTHMLNEHMVNRPLGMNNYAGAGNYQELASAWNAKLRSYYPGIPLWGVLTIPHANSNDDGYTTGANNAPSSAYSTWTETPADNNCLANWIIDHLPGGALEDEYDFVIEAWKSGIALDEGANRDRWKPRSCDCTLAADVAYGDTISLNADRAPKVGEAITIDPRGHREEFTVFAVTGSGPYTVQLDRFLAYSYLTDDRVILGYYGQLTAAYANTGSTVYVDRDPGVGTRLVINPLLLNGYGRGATVVANVTGSGPYTLTNIGKANSTEEIGADVLEGPTDGYHVCGRSCYESEANFWSPLLVAQGVAAVPGVPHLSLAGIPGLEAGSDPWLILTASDAQLASARSILDTVSAQSGTGLDGGSAKLKVHAVAAGCYVGQALPNDWDSDLANPVPAMVVDHLNDILGENTEKLNLSYPSFAKSEAIRQALVDQGYTFDGVPGHLLLQWGGGNLPASFSSALDAATTQGDLETLFADRCADWAATFDGSAANKPTTSFVDLINETPLSSGDVRTDNKYYEAAARIWSYSDPWDYQAKLLEVEFAQAAAASLYNTTDRQLAIRDFNMMQKVDNATKLDASTNNRSPVGNRLITAGYNSEWAKAMANLHIAQEMAVRGTPFGYFIDQGHFRCDQAFAVRELEHFFASVEWTGMEFGIGELNIIDKLVSAMTDYFKLDLLVTGDHSERHRAYAFAHVYQLLTIAFRRTRMRHLVFWTDSDTSGGHTCLPLMGVDQVDGKEKLSWLYYAAYRALKESVLPALRTGTIEYFLDDLRGSSRLPYGWALDGSAVPHTSYDGVNLTTFAGDLLAPMAHYGAYHGNAGSWSFLGNAIAITWEGHAAPVSATDLNSATSWCLADITDGSENLVGPVGPNNRAQLRIPGTGGSQGVLQFNALTTAGTTTINTTDIGTPGTSGRSTVILRSDPSGMVACLDEATPVSMAYTMGAPVNLTVGHFLGSALQTGQWANGPRLVHVTALKHSDVDTDAKLKAMTAHLRAESYAAGIPVDQLANIWEYAA